MGDGQAVFENCYREGKIAMLVSKTLHVTAVPNDEALEDAVIGAAGYKRVIKKVWCEKTADRTLRGYKDTERILDVSCEAVQLSLLDIPVECELTEGQVFKVGWYDRSGAGADQDIVVFYEETEL